MEMLVRRDRNRPSVFLWSTGNEEMAYHCMPQGDRIQRAMSHAVHKLDPTRPVTTAVTNLQDATVYAVCDVIGANYSFRHLEEVHRRFPEKPFLSSENCAIGSTRAGITVTVPHGDSWMRATAIRNPTVFRCSAGRKPGSTS